MFNADKQIINKIKQIKWAHTPQGDKGWLNKSLLTLIEQFSRAKTSCYRDVIVTNDKSILRYFLNLCWMASEKERNKGTRREKTLFYGESPHLHYIPRLFATVDKILLMKKLIYMFFSLIFCFSYPFITRESLLKTANVNNKRNY